MGQVIKKIKVLVADQQPLFRQGVRSSVQQADDIEICGEVGSAQELLSVVGTVVPDVVLLSSDLSGSGAADLAKTVKQQVPSVAVVLLARQPDDEGLFQAIKSRAAGYLSREVGWEELLNAIHRAADGEHPINDSVVARPKVAEQVLKQFQDLSWGKGVEEYVSPLTPREKEILTYMGQGYFNKQIAATLNISEQTIKNHVTSILRKLDANARTEAVVTAIKRGLISLN